MTSPTSTRTDKRQALIEGLRDLAAFLERHPDLPINGGAEVSYCVPGDDDTAGIAATEAIAAAAGVTVTANRYGEPATAETTHFYATRRFGPVAYQATYIRRRDMDDYVALMSYSGTVRADVTQESEDREC